MMIMTTPPVVATYPIAGTRVDVYSYNTSFHAAFLIRTADALNAIAAVNHERAVDFAILACGNLSYLDKSGTFVDLDLVKNFLSAHTLTS